MKFLLTPIIVVSLSVLCLATPPETMSDVNLKTLGDSPDGKYSIHVSESDQMGFVYRLIRLDTHQVLLDRPSSYQPVGADDRTFAQETTEDAVVSWSADSRFVAIDESNVRFKGTVLCSFISAENKAEILPVPTADIERISGERWYQVRLSVGAGWSEDGVIGLTIAGRACEDKVSGDKLLPDLVGYDVTLKLAHTLVIKSIRGGQDEE